jgi:hypothetical protein
VNTMPCDCPEDKPVRPIPTGGCNYLVCTNGPPSSLYRLVEQAIPDVELTHGRPIIYSDGSLEFPESPPPALSGYRAEGRRLDPAWPPCPNRILRVQVIDKVLQIAGICGCPEAAGQFGEEATPDQCQNCPVRRPSA